MLVATHRHEEEGRTLILRPSRRRSEPGTQPVRSSRPRTAVASRAWDTQGWRIRKAHPIARACRTVSCGRHAPSTMGTDTTRLTASAYMAILGAGLRFVVQLIHPGRAVVDGRPRRGVATAMSASSGPLAGSSAWRSSGPSSTAASRTSRATVCRPRSRSGCRSRDNRRLRARRAAGACGPAM